MKRLGQIFVFIIGLICFGRNLFAQTTNSSPYCYGAYSQTPCNQAGPSNAPGNFINDFIDDFSTTGANTNISNIGSGCNSGTLVSGTNTLTVNYANFCSHYLAVSPGQTIVCTMRSGITFGQGFAIWVDWNQDNTFNVPGEYMGGTAGVPAPATNTTITFVIPSTQPNGTYRMRVRCVYATAGAGISPCGAYTFGETEDYTLFVGPIPSNNTVPTGTAEVNSPICVGQTLNFSLTTTYTSALSYSWTGPGGFTSTLQNPIIANASTTNNGVYTVLVTNSICPIVRTVQATVVPYPNFTVVPATHTICQGGNFTPTASMTTNPALYSYTWASNSPGTIFNPNQQSTYIIPGLLPVNVPLANVVYSVTVSPSVHSCPITKTMTLTINNPLTPTLTMPPVQCDIFSVVQLSATPGGGTWTANPAVTPLGSFNPGVASIGTNTVMYSVAIGTCLVSNTATLDVLKYHTAALSSSISSRCVQDPSFYLMNIVQDTITGHWSGPQVSNNFFTSAGLATGNYSLTYQTVGTPSTAANLGVCPASTVLVVPVFNPPTPIISSITPLCDNAATVMLTANPSGGVWSGNAGVTNLGIRTPSLNSIGTNTVTYTAGQGTCVASSSATFHTSRYNTAALTGTVPHLCVSSNPFNLMSIVQNTNGSWSGINITNGYFSPASLPSNTYQLVYTTTSTPNPYLCGETSSITVSVLNPITPNITQVGPFCSTDAPVQLSVTPTNGHWVTSSYLSSAGVYSPGLSPIGNNMVQYIVGTSTCNVSQSKIISTEAYVSSAITSSISDLCNTSPPLNLTPFTQNGGGSWSGPGIVGNGFDPSSAGAGNFVLVYHTASSPSGLCPDQSTVAVNVYSLASPVINEVGPFCNNSAPIQLQVNPAGGVFGGAASGALSPSGIFNPALAFIGDNFVSYTIQVGPCLADSRMKISVEKFVSADFTNSGNLVFCKNTLPFNLDGLVQNPGYYWSGGKAVKGNMFDPQEAEIGSNLVVYETHSEPSTLLCPDSKTIQITVKDTQPVTVSSNKNEGCAPVEVLLNCPSVNSGNGVWNISDGHEEHGLSIVYTFTNPGTYTVVFNYTDNEDAGCKSSAQLIEPIKVYASPKADFIMNPEQVTISEPFLNLNNTSTYLTDNKYRWSINGQVFSTDINAFYNFDKIGSYKITLLATSIHDCSNETSKFIEVKNEFKIYIPNSFTPNYDGLNDVFIPVFSPYGLDSKSYEMQIYDRWGHLVFQSKDPAKGWDGTFKNSGDQIMKKDNYVFRIKYKDLDGKTYEEKGTVTLIPN